MLMLVIQFLYHDRLSLYRALYQQLLHVTKPDIIVQLRVSAVIAITIYVFIFILFVIVHK